MTGDIPPTDVPQPEQPVQPDGDAPSKPKRAYTLRKAKPNKREQILESALRVFCFYGYDATTFQMIAREAGVSASLVVKHFSDKQAIVRICLDRFFARFAERARWSASLNNITYEEHTDNMFEFVKLNRATWLFVFTFMMTPAHSGVLGKISLDTAALGVELISHFPDRCPENKRAALGHAMAGLYLCYIVGGDERMFRMTRQEVFSHYLI